MSLQTMSNSPCTTAMWSALEWTQINTQKQLTREGQILYFKGYLTGWQICPTDSTTRFTSGRIVIWWVSDNWLIENAWLMTAGGFLHFLYSPNSNHWTVVQHIRKGILITRWDLFGYWSTWFFEYVELRWCKCYLMHSGPTGIFSWFFNILLYYFWIKMKTVIYSKILKKILNQLFASLITLKAW